MRFLVRIIFVVAVMVSLAGCGGNGTQGGTPEPDAGRHHARARILIKEDSGGVCVTRTVPNSHAVIKGEEDEIIWDIKVKDGCYPDHDFVLKWKVAGRNPTTCTEIASTDTGSSRQRLKCDLDPSAADGSYGYDVYVRKDGVDTRIEDPDVEIVTF
jgi:hypothetical protein